ncbi:unnamed protein product [Blepharisma stoltei]|uniref:C2H2-type domain-containing protein n=1 Tax=Blepharisma stoltei TaxID=1481888 RepID=A0AAU9IIX4_9CILI|nr:unnamed protein product [Blepharisma stoltei]
MKQFKCNLPGCDLEYSTKYNLNRHIRVFHVGVRYRCDECGQLLSSAQNLQDHMYVHTGEKPYICKAKGCGKRYRQVSQLSVHKRKHMKACVPRKNFIIDWKIKLFIDEKPMIFEIPSGPYKLEDIKLSPIFC